MQSRINQILLIKNRFSSNISAYMNGDIIKEQCVEERMLTVFLREKKSLSLKEITLKSRRLKICKRA